MSWNPATPAWNFANTMIETAKVSTDTTRPTRFSRTSLRGDSATRSVPASGSSSKRLSHGKFCEVIGISLAPRVALRGCSSGPQHDVEDDQRGATEDAHGIVPDEPGLQLP